MRIVIGAVLAALAFIAAAQALPKADAPDEVGVQCMLGAFRLHDQHPGGPLPATCSDVPGVDTGGYATHLWGGWDDFIVEVVGSDGGKSVTFSRGGETARPVPRMAGCEGNVCCTDDRTYCCRWKVPNAPPVCGINTGGPL